MQPPRSLASRLALLGGGLLLLALCSIGLTLWVTWQLEGGAAAVNEAGRMRMQTWRLAATLQGGAPGAAETLARRFDDSLGLLRHGDPARPLLVPWDEAVSQAFEQVDAGWWQLRRGWLAPSGPPPSAELGRQAAEFVTRIDRLVHAVEEHMARWTSVLHLFQLAVLGLALASAVALTYAAHLFIFAPLGRLSAGLQSIERGDLSARVPAEATEEFGALSRGFNSMAKTLQSLYRDLEGKVREKTARLEVERQRLADLYDVSAFLATADSLDDLARGFAARIKRVAGADAVAVRWSDEGNLRYHLLAGANLPKGMTDDERCLRTGQCMCGQSALDAHTRVIRILPSEASGMLGHCAREGYATLVSVPVKLQQRLLGEIDLFFTRPRVLDDDERGLLDTLASHLASAMESLRAAALEREAAVADERGLLARELHDSIAQSLSFLKIQVQLLRQAHERRDEAAVGEVVDELDAGVRESLSDVRELLVHFRTRTNAEDIEPALRSTLQKFEHQTGLTTQLQIEGQGLPLDPDVQVQVLHVLQEALSNVRKHAHASRVWLEVEAGEGWRFELRDDGVGFDAASPRGELHVGLRIMRERAQRIGATLDIDSVPGSGSCVVLTVPPNARVPAHASAARQAGAGRAAAAAR